PMVEYTINYVRRLYDNGFYALADLYITEGKRIILNRSRGTESNFFAVVEGGLGSVDIYFSDPRTDDKALELGRDDVIHKEKYGGGGIFRYAFGGFGDPGKGFEIANRTLEFSALKDIREYRCFLHSHLGYINVNGKDEALWGDGRTKDRYWILHTILAHGDVHALTEHNWTQNEERLGALKERCEAANIVFVPGWENTTVVEDKEAEDYYAEELIKAPHILCYCANIDVAMKVKQNFLMHKLRKNTAITPIFCGVPAPFDEHIRFIMEYHDQGLLGVVIAHPFSLMPGIDLCDPNNLKKLGAVKIKWLFGAADGVEKNNGGENHSKIDIDLSGEKEYGGFVKWIKEKLSENSMPEYPSAPNLNELMGRMAEKGGKHSIYGQDDHLLYDISPKCTSPYNQGHTKLTIPEQAFSILRSAGRKITSEEFVHSMTKGTLKVSDEAVVMRSVAFAKMTEKGPDIVEPRKDTTLQKLVGKVKSVPYYTNVAKLTLQHWYAKHVLKDESRIREIAKELEKEKSYNIMPK
ncbi:MAG: hypothetical protein QW112_00120, partial [Candidatus Micrarchaeia archaeon]